MLCLNMYIYRYSIFVWASILDPPKKSGSATKRWESWRKLWQVKVFSQKTFPLGWATFWSLEMRSRKAIKWLLSKMELIQINNKMNNLAKLQRKPFQASTPSLVLRNWWGNTRRQFWTVKLPTGTSTKNGRQLLQPLGSCLASFQSVCFGGKGFFFEKKKENNEPRSEWQALEKSNSFSACCF